MRCLTLLFVSLLTTIWGMSQEYRIVEIKDAPFEMASIHEFIYPTKDFNIKKFGAKADGKTVNTKAIAKAIKACNKAGGGHVVVPAGEWITGPIHLMDNVDLHLEEGARLVFTDNPADYLPAVFTTWEGVECYNYSPLIYAFECKNIKISGTGTLAPKMDLWKVWFKRPQAHQDATRELYRWCSELTPVEERRLTDLPESNMRPHLIQLNRCKNIVLEDFKIRESPFWTIHLYMCDEGVVRGLDVYAHGHNNDGIDIDMTSNLLVENCHFNQGDDAVVIKAGRNQDAWRLNKPTENIVVRNCVVEDGHVLLGVGSEMSGGVRNVWMHDCRAVGDVKAVFYVKTNHRRGGFVKNIYMERAQVRSAQRLVAVDTDVLYQWRKLPDYDTVYTEIDGLHVKDLECDSVGIAIDLNGDEHLPIRNVEIENLKVGLVTKYATNINNVENVTIKNADFVTSRDGILRKTY